jgi:hypothetical protein
VCLVDVGDWERFDPPAFKKGRSLTSFTKCWEYWGVHDLAFSDTPHNQMERLTLYNFSRGLAFESLSANSDFY